MYQQEGESAIAFANRVKSVIAKQGGLVDLIWDGQLKRNKARKEWKEQQQEEFTKRLKANEWLGRAGPPRPVEVKTIINDGDDILR